MRDLVKDFLKLCIEHLEIREPIYEFGSYQVPGQEKTANIRPLFPGKKYIGADLQPGPGVDIILDLHKISLPSGSVPTSLLLDTLEHVACPQCALKELHRILTKTGILIITTVMNFEIHNYPNDYWRFTPNGLRLLLSPFTFSVVYHVGKPRFPHTILAVAFNTHPIPSTLELLNEWLNTFQHKWEKGW